MAIRCPNCGNENPDDYVYCDECGARLPAPAAVGGGSGTPDYAADAPASGVADAGAADVSSADSGATNMWNMPEEPAAPVAASPDYSADSSADSSTVDAAPVADSGMGDDFAASGDESAAPSVPAATVRCPNCGHENLPGAAFCDDCGASLLNVQPADSAPAADAPAEVEPVAAAPVDEYNQWSRPAETAETPVAEAPVPASEDTVAVPTQPATSDWSATPDWGQAPSGEAPADSGTPSEPVSTWQPEAPSAPESTWQAETPATPEAQPDAWQPAVADAAVEEPSVAAPEVAAPEPVAPEPEAPLMTATPIAPPPVALAPATGTCRNCGAPLRPDALFCARCGTPVAQPKKLECPNCGMDLEGDDVFCPRCGTRVDSITGASSQLPAPVAAAPAPPPPAPVVATPPPPAPAPVAPPISAPPPPPPAPIMVEPAYNEPVIAAPPPVVAPPPALRPLPGMSMPSASAPPAAAPLTPPVVPLPQPLTPGTAPFTDLQAGGALSLGEPRLEMLGSNKSLPLPDKAEILVGREDPLSDPPIFPDVDLTPFGGEEGGVSRRHARILRQGNDFMVEDLQSTNYTKLNGQRIAPRTPMLLVDGSRIDFGKVGVVFRR